MEVGLIGSAIGFGSLDWYTKGLYDGLRKEGINVEVIWSPQPTFVGGQTLHHSFLLPSHILKVAKKFDIIHATQLGFTVIFPFLRGIGRVVTIHDLIPLLYPEEFSHSIPSKCINLSAFFFWLSTSKCAEKIIADSSQTKSDIVRFGYPKEKIEVVNLWIRPTIRRVKVKKNKTVLGYLGAVTYRKDVKYIIKAFHEFQKYDKNAALWICGSGSDPRYVEEVKGLTIELGIAKKVIFMESLPEEEISKIYSSFDVFVSGTRSEGFGLIILEAQKCGVPVIVREEARIPEEVKRYCIQAKSPKDMAEKAFNIIKNEKFRQKQVKLGMGYAAKFNLQKAIKKTINVYEELVKY